MKKIFPLKVKVNINKDYILLIKNLLLILFTICGTYILGKFEDYKILFMSCIISNLFYWLIFNKIILIK
jgi:hypothetical protein